MSKNNPAKGGSFYVQSKVWCAKEEIMKDFREQEKAWYESKGLKEEEIGKERDKEEKKEDKKDEKKEENAEEKK